MLNYDTIRQKDFLLPIFYNDEGKIRLARVREELKHQNITDEDLVRIYKKWRDENEYVVYAQVNYDYSIQYRAIKCSKRGNDVYNWRIKQRFAEMDALAESYGDEKIFDINEPEPKTNCLFVTFTYDTKLTDRESAWNQISKDYNRTITRLRRKYGKINVLRVWESSKRGYPHIHAIMMFEKKSFSVFEHWNKGSTKSSFRIQEKYEFDKVWHSNVDVLAVSSVKGVLSYITKYLRKVYSGNSKYELTIARLWIHRKQSFAISGQFLEQLRNIRLDSRSLHNSNKKLVQTTLEGIKLKPKFVFVGIFTLDEIKQNNTIKYPDSWVFSLKKLPEKKHIQNCEASSEFPSWNWGTNEMRSHEIAKQREDSLLLEGQFLPLPICR